MSTTPSSPIDQHQYIVLLTIVSSQPGEWLPDHDPSNAQPLLHRLVRVQATVREVLKAPEGHRIEPGLQFQAEQRKPVTNFRSEDYGPWSEVDLTAGVVLLVFANANHSGASVEMTIARGSDLIITIPSPLAPYAVEDVRRVVAWEKAAGRHPLGSAEVRRAIVAEKSASGPLMASYLVGSPLSRDLSDSAVAEAHKFFLELLQSPDANERFRLVILTHEVNELAMADEPPRWFRASLIRAMLRVLGEDGREMLHDPIRQAYLFNAVFNGEEKPQLSEHEVFSSDADRTAFGGVLAKRKFAPEKQAMFSRWSKKE